MAKIADVQVGDRIVLPGRPIPPPDDRPDQVAVLRAHIEDLENQLVTQQVGVPDWALRALADRWEVLAEIGDVDPGLASGLRGCAQDLRAITIADGSTPRSLVREAADQAAPDAQPGTEVQVGGPST